MSSIYKLSIQGIRSFNSDHPETIQFGFPLTLICGQNGCGKTTIIECLKYATTGFLPPNSKGGAFINDPNMGTRNIVTAQIKLAFKSVTGESMIITRSMQLSKKGKDKYTFKTLENQLSKINRGEKSTISGKSSDLDNDLPLYLGISKSMLDYVIFCHQDESLWPLSEPSQLKKKFDDIFQALKFTKILDNLKSINKDIGVDIKVLEKSVEHLNIDKKRSSKILNSVSDLKEKTEGLNSDISQLSLEIDENEHNLQRLFDSNQEFQSILSKNDQLLYSKKSLQQQFDRLSSSMEILPDSYDELMKKLDNFDEILHKNKDKISKLNEEESDLSLSLTSCQSKLNELNRQSGSLLAKKDVYENNSKKLKEIFGSQNHDQYVFDLNQKLKTLQDTFDDFKSKNATIKSESDEKLASISNSISNKQNFITINEKSVEDFKKKLYDLTEKISNLNSNEEDLKFETSQLNEMRLKLSELKSSLFLTKLSLEIDDNDKRLVTLEDELDNINKTIRASNNQNDLINRLKYIKESHSQKASSLDSGLKKLESLLMTSVTENDYEEIYNNKFDEKSNEFNTFKDKNDQTINSMNSTDTLIKFNQDKLSNITQKINDLKPKIFSKISESELHEYDQILEDLEEDYHTTIESLNTFEISKQFKIKAVDIAKDKHNCTLCQRSFDDNQLSDFLLLMKSDIENMSVEKLQKDIEDAKESYESLKSINSDIIDYKNCIEEQKELSKATEELQRKHSTLSKEYEKSNEAYLKFQDSFDDFKVNKNLIVTLKKDILQSRQFSERLKTITLELNESGVSTDVNLDELNKSYNDKTLEIKNLRSKINSDKELRFENERKLSKLEGNIKDKEIEIKNIEASLKELVQSQDMKGYYERDKRELEQEIEAAQEELKHLNNQFSQEKTKTNELFEDIEFQEGIKMDEIQEVLNQKETIDNLNLLINEYETNDFPILNKNNEDISKLNEKIESINDNLKRIHDNIKELDKKINESSNFKSTIRDNIDYKNLENEINNVEVEINQLDIKDAEEKKLQYQDESKRLRDINSRLSSDHADKIGQVKQIKNQIQSLVQELNSEYKDVEKVYHNEWIKLQTNLLISNDITNYGKSLDNAIMKFHSVKMAEINKILRDLWMNTYKGSDIDYIAIKSDVNTQSKGNRSYNYRVVMYKSTVELDMRGRCSAGQKVLTSILIRLALAECFGSNCGIIALDEPTTNLDQENAESLAESLNKIIEFRKDQKNFQLIVITHDERFLGHINGDRFADNFYKVLRDEMQFTNIKSLPILVIQEE